MAQQAGVLTLARRVLAEAGFRDRTPVLLAVSGGADSMALLHTMVRLAHEGFCTPRVLSFDHGLRSSSAAEVRDVLHYATSLGVPAEGAALNLDDGADLQERARDARRRFLSDHAAAHQIAWIATGHHADDRAETVLMRLLRGTGPAGLAALPPVAPPYIRPLIYTRRAQLRAHCSKFKIPFVDDPSNANPRFLRARVRHELLPKMVELNPRAVEHLCDLAEKSAPPPLVSAPHRV